MNSCSSAEDEGSSSSCATALVVEGMNSSSLVVSTSSHPITCHQDLTVSCQAAVAVNSATSAVAADEEALNTSSATEMPSISGTSMALEEGLAGSCPVTEAVGTSSDEGLTATPLSCEQQEDTSSPTAAAFSEEGPSAVSPSHEEVATHGFNASGSFWDEIRAPIASGSLERAFSGVSIHHHEVAAAGSRASEF